jgi:hypothetical protein
VTRPDDTPPSWAEHADDLRGEQRALAILRALLADDDTVLEAALDDLYEAIEQGAATGDYHQLETYQASQALVALRFGQQLHGSRLDDELARMQAALAHHIGTYQPDPDKP